MTTKRKRKGTQYDHDAFQEKLAETMRIQETCQGCGTRYHGSGSGNGPRSYGAGDGTPGGRWIFDCCNPDYNDDEIKGDDG